MNDLVKLPSYEWFLGQMNLGGKGNTYAGSYGTDPYLGCLKSDSFRYRIWIAEDENKNRTLKAIQYIGTDCFDVTDKEILTEKTFEASADGVNEAQSWVIDGVNSFIKNKKEN
jgi:hypothetical protein